MSRKTIGIKANYYPEQRNFSGLEIKNYNFKKVIDVYKVIAYVYFKLVKRTHPKWLNLFNDFNVGKYDCLHFFNAVSLGSKPWITTFEYYLPRGAHQIGRYQSEKKYIDKVLKALAKKSCKKIIAISNHAKESQIRYLSNYDTHISQVIISKIVVLHPPQRLIIKSLNEKKTSKSLQLILIGSDFFRKGGLEVLQVLDKLLEKSADINLVIVSKLQYGDYASNSSAADLMEAKRLINKHSKISHFDSMPNSEVLRLLKESDIALLPSYDETYGYSVLEAQACGCPVVTTNGGAFTEINNNACGWIIEVPLIENRSIPYNSDDKLVFQNIVKTQLQEIINEALNNKDLIKMKAELCIDRIKKQHSVENAAEALKGIYDSATM